MCVQGTQERHLLLPAVTHQPAGPAGGGDRRGGRGVNTCDNHLPHLAPGGGAAHCSTTGH